VKTLQATAIIASLCVLALVANPALAQTSGSSLSTPDPVEIFIIVIGALAVVVIGVAYAVQSRRNGSDQK